MPFSAWRSTSRGIRLSEAQREGRRPSPFGLRPSPTRCQRFLIGAAPTTWKRDMMETETPQEPEPPQQSEQPQK
jgi:hypothetical protein